MRYSGERIDRYSHIRRVAALFFYALNVFVHNDFCRFDVEHRLRNFTKLKQI